jgi:predicted transcriptional regulator
MTKLTKAKVLNYLKLLEDNGVEDITSTELSEVMYEGNITAASIMLANLYLKGYLEREEMTNGKLRYRYKLTELGRLNEVGNTEHLKKLKDLYNVVL